MDEQVVRPTDEFLRLTRDFICVRVTDMSRVDLSRYRFDYDLTFAILMMHPDGTIYHRFGSRDHKDPMGWMSMPALIRLMRMTLAQHAFYKAKPNPPKLAEPRTILDVPNFKKRTAGKKLECVHCHSVQPALHEDAREKGTWQADDIWIYPIPDQIGIEVDRTRQNKIRAVAPTSPASMAGLKMSDELLSIGGIRVGSYADLQAALHEAPSGETELVVEYKRRNTKETATLALPKGWKVGTPLGFSWRPSKWDLQPSPGFGGRPISKERRARLGVVDGDFAFEVTYLVTWGPWQRRGVAARQAGLRKGDVVLAVAGKRDFTSHDHFHSWYRLTRKVGERVKIEVARGDERLTVELPIAK